MLLGKIRESWGALTDDEIAAFYGRQEQRVGAVQRRYGIAREEALKRIYAWQDANSEKAA
jgi:uncharacterized protein YjbJ (UPF0337 family)